MINFENEMVLVGKVGAKGFDFADEINELIDEYDTMFSKEIKMTVMATLMDIFFGEDSSEVAVEIAEKVKKVNKEVGTFTI